MKGYNLRFQLTINSCDLYFTVQNVMTNDQKDNESAKGFVNKVHFKRPNVALSDLG